MFRMIRIMTQINIWKQTGNFPYHFNHSLNLPPKVLRNCLLLYPCGVCFPNVCYFISQGFWYTYILHTLNFVFRLNSIMCVSGRHYNEHRGGEGALPWDPGHQYTQLPGDIYHEIHHDEFLHASLSPRCLSWRSPSGSESPLRWATCWPPPSPLPPAFQVWINVPYQRIDRLTAGARNVKSEDSEVSPAPAGVIRLEERSISTAHEVF